jgi:hypothetical protein
MMVETNTKLTKAKVVILVISLLLRQKLAVQWFVPRAVWKKPTLERRGPDYSLFKYIKLPHGSIR